MEERQSRILTGVNNTVLGMTKDEFGGETMKEVVDLSSKRYSVLKGGDENLKKSKGAQVGGLTHQDYLNSLKMEEKRKM